MPKTKNGPTTEELEANKPTERKRKLLTRPLFSLNHTPHMFVRVTGKMFTKGIPGLTKDGAADAVLLPVVNIETGEEGDLIVPAIVASTLTDGDGEYVGHEYELVSGEIREGKRYRDVRVYLLD